MSGARREVQKLTDLCLVALAKNINRVPNLDGLPEELVSELFEEVLKQGRLTPRALRIFEDTRHEALLRRVLSLKIRSVPPVLPTTHHKWLGD